MPHHPTRHGLGTLLFAVAATFPGLSFADDAPGDAAPPASPPAPPTDIVVEDRPDDAGDGLVVRWTLSKDDTEDADPRTVLKYVVERKPAKGGEFEQVGESTYKQPEFEDEVDHGTAYLYRVVAVGRGDVRSPAAESTEAVQPVLQWFNGRRAWFGILLLVVCGSVVYFIQIARRGTDLYIRPIAGLEAVDEAVGRATEMGKSVLFVPGIQDINDIQTVAGITVLSRVARTVAEYDAELVVPTARSLVMTTAQETVEAAYLSAGRPDAYREDDVYYLTDEQFGYVAGVTGTMVRDEPAACFYMGAFYAESLILAETANSIGAIQVAGTAMPSQLPFFVAACDYTLIGEEFFAASAYLSGEAHQLGSLKGQDVGKGIGATLVVLGCLVLTATTLFTVRGFDVGLLTAIGDYLTQNVLGDGGLSR